MGQPQATLASHVFSVDRRRAQRSEIYITTHARLPGRELTPIEIVNASIGGIMARSTRGIAERTRVQVDMPGMGWLPATVVWSFGEQHGLSFDRPLNPHYLTSLIALHDNSC